MSLDTHQPIQQTWASIQKFSTYTWNSIGKPVYEASYPVVSDALNEIRQTFSLYEQNKDHPPSLISSIYFTTNAYVCLKSCYFLKITSLFLLVFGLNKSSKSIAGYAHTALSYSGQTFSEAKACFPLQLRKPLNLESTAVYQNIKTTANDKFLALGAFYKTSIKPSTNKLLFNLTAHPHFSKK